MPADNDNVLMNALRGLRQNSLKAQRKKDPSLMIAIGLAEPEAAPEAGAEEDDEGEEDEDSYPMMRARR